jgi:hypothetical protein
MSLPHNHAPRIGQKFEYCGAVIEYRLKSQSFFYFFESEGKWRRFYKDEFPYLNLKALT